MNPILFPECNAVRRAPDGMPEGACTDVHVYADPHSCVTCWQPTPEERAAIAAGGPVWVNCVMGGTMPPISVHGLTPFIQPPTPERLAEMQEGAACCLFCAQFQFGGEAHGCGHCTRWDRITAFHHECVDFNRADSASRRQP